MPTRVRLRTLTRSESRLLQSKLPDVPLSVRVRQRYRIIDKVRNGHGVLQTADRAGCHFTVAYDWIHRFNASGFATSEQVPNPKGRPPILRAAQLRELVEVEAGQSATVRQVSDRDAGMLRYLAALGFFPGATVQVLEKAPYEGPLRVRIGGAEHAVGRELARHVFVSAGAPGEARSGRTELTRGDA